MGRPARYDVNSLLDAALAIAAERGPSAVSMAAVVERSGAPSGSLYHRFANRPTLLADLWLRSVERFQAGFLAAAARENAMDAALAAAAHTIEWSRANPEQARVLLYGAADFGLDSWPPEARERWQRCEAEVGAAIERLAERLGLDDRGGRERLRLAIVDIPLALVRRRLGAGERPPEGAERMIEPAVLALLRNRA